MPYPILQNKHYTEPSVFTAENMLREARRQKAIAEGAVPLVCVLDPDGDIVQYLIATQQATPLPNWACYHTKLYRFMRDGVEYGIVPHVVGASFAVLVAEELFACGCRLLISITSAGQIVPMGQPPYFVLIDKALRDEGTSYHYLPPDKYSHLPNKLFTQFTAALEQMQDNNGIGLRMLKGSTWTTDAPFRETEAAIAFARQEHILGVEMEAAALYAYAEVTGNAIVCFAHITNQMAQIEGDFEKGEAQGSVEALKLIAWARSHAL